MPRTSDAALAAAGQSIMMRCKLTSQRMVVSMPASFALYPCWQSFHLTKLPAGPEHPPSPSPLGSSTAPRLAVNQARAHERMWLTARLRAGLERHEARACVLRLCGRQRVLSDGAARAQDRAVQARHLPGQAPYAGPYPTHAVMVYVCTCPPWL
jgi:hypothetical protein